MVRNIIRDIADVGRLGLALIEQAMHPQRKLEAPRAAAEEALDDWQIIFEPERPAINTGTGAIEFWVVGDEDFPDPWEEIAEFIIEEDDE